MEALLDCKDLFEDAILKDEPTNAETDKKSSEIHMRWSKKNKEACSLIILSLSSNQAIIFRNIKIAKKLWNDIKLRHQGVLEDKVMDLTLKLTRIKKMTEESVEQYLVRAQGIASSMRDLGKEISERELIRYITEGLPESYEVISTALSINRNISLLELRHGLTKFETSIQSNAKEHQVYKAQEKYVNKEKTCYCCGKKGHLIKDCWFNKRRNDNLNMRYNRENERVNSVNESEGPVREGASEKTSHGEYAYYSTFSDERDDDLDEWLLDSACTSHMTCRRDFMENQVSENRIINVAEENRNIESYLKGNIHVITDNNVKIRLEDTLFVPKLRNNLISIPKLVEKGYEVLLNKSGAYVRKNGEVISKGGFVNNMFSVKFRYNKNYTNDDNCFFSVQSSKELWHRRLGHINGDYLDMMANKNMVRGLDKIEGVINFCKPCSLGKINRTPISHPTFTEERPLDILYCDVCGPMNEPSIGGNRYMLIVVDGFSRRYFVELLKTKDQVAYKLKSLIMRRENELGLKVGRVRTDNGSEFLNKELASFFEKMGIKHEKTTIYNPRSNGCAERANRTLLEMTRTLLTEANLPANFWGEAIKTAEYIHNILPTRGKEKTPMELWSGLKPTVKHIKIFGCTAYYKVEEIRRKKLDPKGKKGIFIGYSRERKAYRIYDQNTGKIYETLNVKFDESAMGYEISKKYQKNPSFILLSEKVEDFNQHREDNNEEDNENRINDSNAQNRNENEVIEESRHEENEIEQNEQNNTEITENTRPNRERRTPVRLNDYVCWTQEYEPKTYQQAISCDDKKLWEAAIEKELKSMKKHEVWDLVERPVNKKVIKNKWVFRIKNTGGERKYKARLVALGNQQTEGVDYTESFSPVIKWQSFRILLCVAASRGAMIEFYDVETAYLNGTLKEETYMERPQGMSDRLNQVCRLKKSLYGLPQSGRCWYEKFSKVLKSLGLTQLKSDPCVFMSYHKQGFIYLGVYVDDFFVISDCKDNIDDLILKIKLEFSLKKNNDQNVFLGIKIEQRENKFFLSQTDYIEKILHKNGMSDSKPVKTPGEMKNNLDDYEQSGKISQKLYQEAIGSLMYISVGTRPDITFMVSRLSQYSQDPREVHWAAIKRIFRYLNGTKTKQLVLGADDGGLSIWTDSSWCTTKDCKSYTGYTIKLGKNLVQWKSQKQRLVTLSTMEAELLAMCDGVTDGRWTTVFLEELELPHLTRRPVEVRTDSQSLISWIKNPRTSGRSKHIDRKYYFVRDDFERGEIEPQYIQTDKMEADIFTKCVPVEKMTEHLNSLGLE